MGRAALSNSGITPKPAPALARHGHRIRGRLNSEKYCRTAKAWIDKEVGGPGRLPIILILASVLGLDAADKGTISAVSGQLENAFGINNFFPARERARYGLILSGEIVGVGIGFFISGEVSSIANWHWSFYVMAVPSLAIAWVVWRFLPEPERGKQGWVSASEQGSAGTDEAVQKTRAARVEPRE